MMVVTIYIIWTNWNPPLFAGMVRSRWDSWWCGCCFLGEGGNLTGIGATGGVTGHESRDEGRDGGGETSTRGSAASMGGSTGSLAGTCVDRLTGLSHLGNCASKNSPCAAVKRTLLGEHINKKLASLPGATPKHASYTCCHILSLCWDSSVDPIQTCTHYVIPVYKAASASQRTPI